MRMQFKAELAAPAANTAFFLFEDDESLTARPELAAVQAILAPLMENGEFKASPLAELPLKTADGWLILVGLGRRDKLTPARLIEAAAKAVGRAVALNSRRLDLALPPAGEIAPGRVLTLTALGALLALYRQTEFKSEPAPAPALTNLIFLGFGSVKNAAKILREAEITAEAVALARRLGDRPANVLYPETFAKEAAALAKRHSLTVEILDEKALTKARLNLIAAVGRGSAHGPRLVTLKYQGAEAGLKPVALVGKGVTFDSGGLSLKPAGSMEGMKTDMSGAAIVLAVTGAAAAMKLPVNLTAVMPLAENMPDGAAVRVGDVIAGRSGRTVEITNTDAEGRLILADALTWAGEMKPAAIIDVATLTGACAVALGDLCAGLFSNDSALRRGLMDAAEAMGEHFWPLPLLDEYEDNLKSETADLINAPTVPRGGAVNAALFLRRFVPAEIPWAHLDIAGPARAGSPRPGTPVGAVGVAVRSLVAYLKSRP
ncbi:MAG: leucyl aminopeptidase [Candidatus Adiutrix sp.]|jgi:leucyl aminopeptidase|nr:leucyl aminopeptidase [Candidatus Adiutrix sp.]